MGTEGETRQASPLQAVLGSKTAGFMYVVHPWCETTPNRSAKPLVVRGLATPSPASNVAYISWQNTLRAQHGKQRRGPIACVHSTNGLEGHTGIQVVRITDPSSEVVPSSPVRIPRDAHLAPLMRRACCLYHQMQSRGGPSLACTLSISRETPSTLIIIDWLVAAGPARKSRKKKAEHRQTRSYPNEGRQQAHTTHSPTSTVIMSSSDKHHQRESTRTSENGQETKEHKRKRATTCGYSTRLLLVQYARKTKKDSKTRTKKKKIKDPTLRTSTPETTYYKRRLQRE